MRGRVCASGCRGADEGMDELVQQMVLVAVQVRWSLENQGQVYCTV